MIQYLDFVVTFAAIAGYILPLTQINIKGQYELVQPFAVFCAERCIYPTLPTNWCIEQTLSVVVLGFRKAIEDGTIENRVCHPSLLEGERLYFLA